MRRAVVAESGTPRPCPAGAEWIPVLRRPAMSDNCDAGWSLSEGTKFFCAYAQHGPKWHAVAAEVGTKDASACEALFLAHTTYLSLPPQYQHEVAFVAMVSDQKKQSVVRERESDDTVSEDTTRGNSAPRFVKARRTPRAGSGGRVPGPPVRSPANVFTPGGRRRTAAIAVEAAAPPAPPAAWGGRGKRGAAVPAASPESSALKRKRVQVRPRFWMWQVRIACTVWFNGHQTG